MRRVILRMLNRPAGLATILLTTLIAPLVLAVPASADPTSDWQQPPTAGIDTATDSLGLQYPYLTLPTGGRWYLECPLEPTHGGPAGTALTPSIPLDKDHDRCGNDQGSNATTYKGATWTTSTFADVNVNPNDVRCGQLVAHRVDANPPDAAGPVFCTSRVLLYPTMNEKIAQALARWWPERVLDSCPQTTDLPTNPHSGLQCAGWKTGTFKNNDHPVPLQWWHGNGHGGVDCARIPNGHVPRSIEAWANGDRSALRRACQVMNNFFSGTPLTFRPTVDLLQAVRAALAESGPDKKPKWVYAVCCGDTRVISTTDWAKVAATVGGCLVGGTGGFAIGGPVGAVLGCAGGGAAGYAVSDFLESLDCALTSWHCIVNAVARWMAHGFIAEMKFALHQLTHGLAPESLFTQDAFIRMWQALALVSALMVALYVLGSFLVSIAVLRPSIALTSARNVLLWGWALAAAIPFTRLLLAAADGVTTFICSWAGARSWQGLSDRFQAVINGALNASLPNAGGATVGLLLLLLLIVGAFAALFLAAWAFVRAAAIALSVLGIPLSAAALAGPPRLRRAPQVAMSALLGLILFKPLVAVVFVLGIGLMGTGTSTGAFLVGIVCVLGAAFAPRHIIRLLGAGIDSVGHGDSGHAAVTAGTAATAFGAQQLYRMGRGRWTSGGGGAGGGVGPGASSASSGTGTEGRAGGLRTMPARAAGSAGESASSGNAQSSTGQNGSALPSPAGVANSPPAGGRGDGAADGGSGRSAGGGVPTAPNGHAVQQIVDRQRAGDQQ